jgi:3-hydroxymyristoyl/3-hydroxydecanoyl-(acyl carrier protein) dehydratase
VTVKLQVLVFPLASVAAHTTGVTPLANALPLGGTHTTVWPGQLSVAVALNVTLLVQLPGAVATVKFPGHVTPGACWSRTVTVKLQVFVFPLASVAVHTTEVIPLANALPLAGTHATVWPGQLSVAVTAKVTLLVQLPGAVATVRFPGQVTPGACWSLTVTVKLQVLVFPLASVAVHTTGVTPLANALPLAGTHATVQPGQLSVAVALNVTLLAQLPTAVATAKLPGQVTAGAC